MVELRLVCGEGQLAPYALVVLADDLRPRIADAPLRTRVQSELEQLLRDVNRELVEHEKLRLRVVAAEPWSIENGFLTPTMKIKHSRIETEIAPLVDAGYASGHSVHWA